MEQAHAQFNTSWSPRFTSLRFGQLFPFAILFKGGAAQMPLSRHVALKTPTRAENSWAPVTRLRGVEVGMVDLPRWNAYVGVGHPQIEALAGDRHTDVYADGGARRDDDAHEGDGRDC